MIHLYTARQYSDDDEKRNREFGFRTREANMFRLLCTKEWMIENEFVGKGPYSRSRPKSVTSVRKHVTCPKCLDTLIPQAEAEFKQMLDAYKREAGYEYHSVDRRGVQIETT